MTAKELKADFEIQFQALIDKGLEFGNVMPVHRVGEGITKSVHGDAEIHPATHYISASRPFIFDIRQLPKSFRGFTIQVMVWQSAVPDEFRLDEDDIVPFEVCWSEERVLAYAEEHVLDICTQLNDYTFTLKDICDMIVGGDFERHKKQLEEESKRSYYEDEEEDD
ncbi:MAG: hypothetical protein POELPBGB_03267 [Bacteroidia bacterium]|nr:hypothetical protein [Bacteroidia bacterium]